MSSTCESICKLCQKHRKLANSHIIPEFMYIGVYDDKHRSLIVESDPNSDERIAQKGVRENILCDECETRISKLETYSAPIIISLVKLEAKSNENYYYVTNVDYARFKLFQLSILWRASVATIKMFDNITLDQYEEQMREMLLSSNPGSPNEFGCFMLLIENTKYLDKIIWSPVSDDIEGYPTIRFQIGRLFLYYFLPNKVPATSKKYFINKNNILIVPKAPWSEEVIVKMIAEKFVEREQKKRK